MHLSVRRRTLSLALMIVWLATMAYPAFTDTGASTGGDRPQATATATEDLPLVGGALGTIEEGWNKLSSARMGLALAGLLALLAVSEGLPGAVCRRVGRCAATLEVAASRG